MLATAQRPLAGIIPETTSQQADERAETPIGTIAPRPASNRMSRVEDSPISNRCLRRRVLAPQMDRVTPAGARKLKSQGDPATKLLAHSGKKTPVNILGPSRSMAANEIPLAGQIGEKEWASPRKACDDAQAVR